ncbi:hypothetical protein DH2020_022692 [Rehmannia glutinosa]|uniref:Uncharacterized protein n=1 Tax=Rehmannia glutinosa TaxID=99300 RepID=A0ABR0W5N8_REHGL
MLGRSSFAQSRNRNFRLCFIVFVIGVLIFTIIAATYEPGSKITNFLTSNSIATFKSDNGVVKTGEVSVASDQTAFAMFINITDLDSAIGTGLEEPMVVPENRHCKADDPIDCRDPDLFHLLMRATIEKFKDIHFYRFGKPVRGDNDSSCHMAWRYRRTKGKQPHLTRITGVLRLQGPRIAQRGAVFKRTLVMDLSVCLSKIYSSSGVDEEGKDFDSTPDFEHLKDSASVTPMKLAEVKDSLIMRKFGSVEPDNYWYRVCEGETESVVQRPWHMIRKSRRLLDVASGIQSRMNWDFDGVRVERGEKAKNTKLWPNLDRDTSPKALMATLRDKIEDGRNIYIATNERGVSFFDPLKEKYSTHFLDEYKDLWDVNSDWYDETTKLNNGNTVEFDGYMRMSVDTEVFLKGKKQIETFNDLTKDCKDGINRCKSTR